MIKQALIIILILVCSKSAFCQSDEKANVLAVERNAADAFTKHNMPALNATFADDINVISATGDVLNKQQLFQSIQNINGVTVSDMKVRIEGYIAIVTGLETETGKDSNGTAYTNKTRFTDILQKTKGQWIIIASQATAIPQ